MTWLWHEPMTYLMRGGHAIKPLSRPCEYEHTSICSTEEDEVCLELGDGRRADGASGAEGDGGRRVAVIQRLWQHYLKMVITYKVHGGH